jgi:dolichol-phosphate mannosyltransferase
MTEPTVQIVIPTYNERENVEPLIATIRHYQRSCGILIVDDGSPDGTGERAEELAASDPLLGVLHRRGPRGFGRSLVEGMLWALERNPDFVIQMDADGSHNPQYLPALLEAARSHDLVIGSRYVGHRVSVVNWPVSRLLLSLFANLYVRAITRLPVCDTTSGFRCWRASALRQIGLQTITSDGYSFLVETLFRAHALGLRITEVPIIFIERRTGASKMNRKVILESAIMPWRLMAARAVRTLPLKPDRVQSHKRSP